MFLKIGLVETTQPQYNSITKSFPQALISLSQGNWNSNSQLPKLKPLNTGGVLSFVDSNVIITYWNSFRNTIPKLDMKKLN